jgi:site-specific recombinase XerD
MNLPVEVDHYVDAHDFSPHTVKAVRSDLSKFIRWFEAANGEQFEFRRITVRDVADFRDHCVRVRRHAVATVNRSLVSVRRLLRHLVDSGALPGNPAAAVKEMKRMPAVPRGLSTAQVRKIMREIELRQDRRAGAIIGLMVYGGLRVSDVVGLELQDVTIGPRSGQVICRNGKGNKQRRVPLPVEARRLLTAYLESRPPTDSQSIFIGERGPLTDVGIRALCAKYSAITGVKFTPHVLRHTFAHRFLENSGNDLVSLGQILGHESLNTTALYTKRSQDDLQQRIDEVHYS